MKSTQPCISKTVSTAEKQSVLKRKKRKYYNENMICLLKRSSFMSDSEFSFSFSNTAPKIDKSMKIILIRHVSTHLNLVFSFLIV